MEGWDGLAFANKELFYWQTLTVPKRAFDKQRGKGPIGGQLYNEMKLLSNKMLVLNNKLAVTSHLENAIWALTYRTKQAILRL